VALAIADTVIHLMPTMDKITVGWWTVVRTVTVGPATVTVAI
jgi:hypothetical protein